LSIGLVWTAYLGMWLLNPQQNILWALAGNYVSPFYAFLPGMYAKGISVIGGERNGYLLGMCYKGSRLEFFPILTLFKTPLPSLLLGMAGPVTWLVTKG